MDQVCIGVIIQHKLRVSLPYAKLHEKSHRAEILPACYCPSLGRDINLVDCNHLFFFSFFNEIEKKGDDLSVYYAVRSNCLMRPLF